MVDGSTIFQTLSAVVAEEAGAAEAEEAEAGEAEAGEAEAEAHSSAHRAVQLHRRVPFPSSRWGAQRKGVLLLHDL